MQNPFVKRLEALTDLSVADRQKIVEIVGASHQFGARETIIRWQERPDHVLVMLSGWASRSETLADGTKQITAFLLPGDFCSTDFTSCCAMDSRITANIDCCVAFVAKDAITALLDRPAIARAMWLSSQAYEGIVRTWLVNVGARDGLTRTAHFLCEIYARLFAIGMAENGKFRLSITQEQFGQALGMTAVHVNRMLRQLESRGMIHALKDRIVITDYDALHHLCDFNPDYLYCTATFDPAIGSSQS